MSFAGKSGTFEEFLEHIQIVIPAVKQLEAKGLDARYIVRLLRFTADWLESRDETKADDRTP